MESKCGTGNHTNPPMKAKPMQTIEVTTFVDLANHAPCKIRNLLNGEVVRKIEIADDFRIHMTAGDGTELDIEPRTPMWYEAWDMDRGSICFRHPSFALDLKAFTEGDLLEQRDGEVFHLVPSEKLLKNGRPSRHTSEAIQTGK